MANCTYVTQLIELCVTSGLKIVSGQVLGDLTGRYACHKYNGTSPADYVLTDNTILSQLSHLGKLLPLHYSNLLRNLNTGKHLKMTNGMIEA